MTSCEAEAHCRAVAHLQALLSKLKPGTLPYRTCERALDLAFNRVFARAAVSEQELLAEASFLISRQRKARLIPEQQTRSPASALNRELAWSLVASQPSGLRDPLSGQPFRLALQGVVERREGRNGFFR